MRVFIGLQELEVRAVPFSLDIPAGKIDYDGKITQLSNLSAQGIAELVNPSIGEIRVAGKLSVTIGAPCDRCLEQAAFPIEREFDLIYMPAEDARSGGEDEIDETAIDVAYYNGAGLELKDVLREVVLLALPMRLVCSELCKGICAVCGRNRNQQDCDCHPETRDDRWSKLKEFRAELSHRN